MNISAEHISEQVVRLQIDGAETLVVVGRKGEGRSVRVLIIQTADPRLSMIGAITLAPDKVGAWVRNQLGRHFQHDFFNVKCVPGES